LIHIEIETLPRGRGKDNQKLTQCWPAAAPAADQQQKLVFGL
jgi:hypothetical protein